VWLALLAAPEARAAAQWLEHYQRGVSLAEAGSWEEAITELGQAAMAEPRPRRQVRTHANGVVLDYDPHYHMARCLVELGRFRQAGAQLVVSARAGVTPRDRIEALRRRLDAASRFGGRLQPPAPPEPLLTVTTRPPGARVWIDGVDRGTSPFGPMALAEGEHTVRVEAPGFATVERELTLQTGQPLRLDLTLVALHVLPNQPAQAEPTAVSAFKSSRSPSPSTPAAVAPTRLPAAASDGVPAATGPAPRVTAPIDPSQAPSHQTVLALGGAAVALAAIAFFLLWRRSSPAPTPTSATRVHDLQTLQSHPTPMQLGEYDLLGTLGHGGMATTHRARRRRDGSEIAIKIPHESCLADATFVARFLLEGRLGEQLHHPGIVRILQVGEHAGRPFLAMELVQGHTLKSEIRELGPLPVRRAVEIARDIAEALDYAHAKGVVHRDLKPDNIMLPPNAPLKVMDFGIARVEGSSGLTTTNIFLGTPLYAAPEMVEPKSVDSRVDLYALGIVLFEMLQGTVPFVADSPYRVLEMHLRQPLPGSDQLGRPVPPEVWGVVEKLCEKDREKRYQTAESLLVDLNRILNTSSGD